MGVRRSQTIDPTTRNDEETSTYSLGVCIPFSGTPTHWWLFIWFGVKLRFGFSTMFPCIPEVLAACFHFQCSRLSRTCCVCLLIPNRMGGKNCYYKEGALHNVSLIPCKRLTVDGIGGHIGLPYFDMEYNCFYLWWKAKCIKNEFSWPLIIASWNQVTKWVGEL